MTELVEYGQMRPPIESIMEGDIIEVLAHRQITTQLHGARGIVCEVIPYHNEDDDTVCIEDLRVEFKVELNDDIERYGEWIRRPQGLMLFPHEVKKVVPEQTWEL